MKKISIFKILLGLALYFISSGISYAAFNLTNLSPPYITASLLNVSPSTKAKYKVDPSVPRDQVCPLNGVKYTKQESDIYDGRRPLAVMMENIVFAPVRSARTYFVDWVSEYDALYNHVGGAGRCNDDTVDTRAKALCQIDRFGIKDLDQFSIGFPDCYRNPDRLDHPVATEHTMVCFSENLYKIAEKRDWTNVDDKDIPWDKNFHEWQFKDNPKADERGSTNSVKITFAKGYDSYITDWNYDRESNSYKRSTGGKIHLDLETKEPLTAKNIVIQLSKITGPVDDHAHILYQTIER